MAGNVIAIYLTEEDLAIVKQLIADAKLKPQNTLRQPPIPPTRSSPGMYIALPQSTISPLTELGSGGGTGTEEGDADIPGSGLCELFRKANDGLHSLGGRLERVYNSSRSTIPREWIQVHQDRFGVWWAIPSVVSEVAVLRGKLTTTLSSGSRFYPTSAIIEVWSFDGLEWAETDELLTVYDDGMLGDGNSPLEVGTWIQIISIGGYWFYDGHNCDPGIGTGS